MVTVMKPAKSVSEARQTLAALRETIWIALDTLGAHAFVIDRIGIVTNAQEWYKARKRPPLGMEDLEALRNGMKLADTIAGEQNTFADVRHGNDLSEDVTIIGATPTFASIRDIDVSNGRLLTDIDEDHRAGVCVIGADVANKIS